MVLTLTLSQLENFEDGKAIQKQCCNKLENNNTQGVFWVAWNAKKHLNDKT